MPSQAAIREPVAPPAAGAGLLQAFRDGTPISQRCVIVVAHPDDETLGVGSRLADLTHLELVHVTPGAPRDDGDARRAGFADAAAYAAARADELDAALARLGAQARRRQLGLVDGEVVHALAKLAATLQPILRDAAAVLTHPYEGGHPDHDAVAAAVQVACRRLGPHAPVRLEFAGYHLEHGEQVSGAFWPDPSRPSVEPRMSAERLAAKCEAFAAFASQAAVLDWFTPEREAYRAAPDYDFAAPPPPGEALYDRWGWTLTSDRWREAAAAALAS